MTLALNFFLQHSQLTRIFKTWANSTVTGSKVDKHQLTIFDVILLMNPDETRLDPGSRKRIESVQMKYVLMLQRYLQDKVPKIFRTKFSDGLMLLHHAKQLYNFHSQRLPI